MADKKYWGAAAVKYGNVFTYFDTTWDTSCCWRGDNATGQMPARGQGRDGDGSALGAHVEMR